MSSIENTDLRPRLHQLESHFTWALNKNDTDLTDLLNRLKEQLKLDLGKKTRIARTQSYMGFVKFLLGSKTEALRDLEESGEQAKSHGNDCDKLLVVPYGNLAWLHYHMGKFEACENYLDKLNEIKEKYPSVPYAEVLGEKGWTFLKFSRKYHKRAKVCFKKALELDPENGEWNTGLAIVLYRTEDIHQDLRSSDAVAQLRRAIDTDPDDDVIKVLLALKLAHHKEDSEAERLLKQALEQSPEHPHVIQYAAKFFRNHGSVDRSIELLKGVSKEASNACFIQHQLGLCYKNKLIRMRKEGGHQRQNAEIKQYQKLCIHHLEKATTLNPSFIIAMSELAFQYGMDGDISKAEQTFKNAFEIAERTNDNHQSVLLYYALFQQYCRRSEPDAIKYYLKCLEINSRQYEWNKSADSLKKIAESRITYNLNDGEAYGILGMIHEKKGEKQEAIKYFEQALSCGDNDEYLRYLTELKLSLH